MRRLYVYIPALLIAQAGSSSAQAPATPAPQAAAAVAGPTAAELAADLESARALVAKKRLSQARTILEKYVAARPDDVDAQWLLGQTYAGLRLQRRALRPLYKVVEADGKRLEAWQLIAPAALSAGYKADAAAAYRQVARLGGKRDAALQAASLFAEVKDPADALRAYKDARALAPYSLDELRAVATVAEAAGAADDAIEAVDALIRAEPEVVGHRVAMARVVGRKDPARAQAELAAVLERDPSQPDALDALAGLAEAAHDDARAADLLARLRAAAPKHATAHRRHGIVLARLGDGARAREAFAAQLAVGADGPSELGLALLDRQQNELGAALGHAERAMAAKTEGSFELAGELYLGLGQPAKAQAAVQKLAEGDKAPADAVYVLGRAQLAQKQLKQARQTLSRLLAQKDARAHEALGDVALADADFKAAFEHYTAALARHEKDPDFLCHTAVAALGAGDGAAAERLLQRTLELQPSHAEASRWYGRALVDKGEIDRALPLLTQALAKYPDDPEVSFAYGKALFGKGDLAAATPALEKALALAPKHVEANALLGLVRHRRGEKGAQELLGRAGLATTNVEALVAHAELLVAEGKLKDAEPVVARAQKLAPGHRGATLALTRLRLAQGRAADAETAIGGYLFANPADRDALVLGGAVAFAAGSHAAAIQRYEAAAKSSPLPADDAVRFADALVRAGRFPDALTTASGAIEAGAGSARAYSLLAYAQFKTGDKERSRESMRTAMQKGADDPYVHLIKGESLLADGEKKAARAELMKVVAVDPRNDTANALLGDAASAAGNTKEAVGWYQKALAANAARTDTRVSLVKALVDAGRPAEARGEIEKLDGGAVPPAVLATLNGRVQYGLGNYRKAQAHFEAALKADPQSFDAAYYQAQNYLKLPHYSKAIELLEQARKVKPGDTEIAAKLAELYAENGEPEKAARAQTDLEGLEQKQLEARRKNIPADRIRTVAVGRFDNSTGQKEHDWIGVALAESLAADLGKLAYLSVVERKQIEKVRAELADEVRRMDQVGGEGGPDLGRLGKLVTADWLLIGNYQVAGEGIRLSAKLVDIKTLKVERSGSQSGGLTSVNALMKRLALELAGELVDISDGERRALSRETATNFESYRLASEAKLLEYQGDVREAQKRYREALKADAANVAAVQGLEKAIQGLGKRNTVAVDDFEAVGDAPAYIGAGLPDTLASKLSAVRGIQVVERKQIQKVKDEIAFKVTLQDIASDGDELKETELPKLADMLDAGIIVMGSYQKAADQVQLTARVIDRETGKSILGDRVSGPESDLLRLQDDLARKIVYAIVGAPSDEEIEALASKQSFAEYKSQMEELARLRADEQRRKDEQAKLAAATPAPAAAAAVEPAPAEAAAAPVPAAAPEEKPAETHESPHTDRYGLAARIGKTSSGTAPGVEVSFLDQGDGSVRAGWVFSFAGDNQSGGRKVGSQAADSSARTLGMGVGMKLTMSFVDLGRVKLGVAGSAELAWFQYLDPSGATLESEGASGTRPQRALTTDTVIELRPALVADWNVAGGLHLTAGLGRNFELLAADNRPSGTGLFVDIGARIEASAGAPVDSKYNLGYRATLLSPQDQATATQYVSDGSPGLLVHGLVIGRDRGDSAWDGVLFLGYAQAAPRGGGDTFRRLEAAWDVTERAFRDQAWVNPFVRARLGVAAMQGTAPDGTTPDKKDGPDWVKKSTALLLGGSLGVEIAPVSFVSLSIALGHDWAFSGSDAKLSGYTLSAGAGFAL